LNSADINSFLYKYEKDIAYIIKEYFNNASQMGDVLYDSQEWNEKVNFRKEKKNELCWNEELSMCFYYDFVSKKQFSF
jgi:alpha,alpha-trehalase